MYEGMTQANYEKIKAIEEQIEKELLKEKIKSEREKRKKEEIAEMERKLEEN